MIKEYRTINESIRSFDDSRMWKTSSMTNWAR